MPNPDPTIVNFSRNVTNPGGTTIGTIIATVTIWEVVAVVVIAPTVLTLPAGRYIGELVVQALGSNIQPPPFVDAMDQTLSSGGSITFPGGTYTQYLHENLATYVGFDLHLTQVVAGVSKPFSTAWGSLADSAVALPAWGPSLWVPGTDFCVDIQAAIGWQTGTVITRAQYLPLLVAAQAIGATSIRANPAWWQLMPTSGGIDATLGAWMDQFVADCVTYGLKLRVTISGRGAPSWAQDSSKGALIGPTPFVWAGGSTNLTVAPWALQSAINTYVGLFMTRWGSQVEWATEANEMNNNQPISNYGSIATPLVEDHAFVYSAVKADAPTVQVEGGVIAGADVAFLEALYTAGFAVGTTHDAVGAHSYNIKISENAYADPSTNLRAQVEGSTWHDPRAPFSENMDPMLGNGAYTYWNMLTLGRGMTLLHEHMRAHGEGNVPIIVSEMGVATGSRVYGNPSEADVSEQTQAKWLSYLLRQAARMGFVGSVGLFSLIDEAGQSAPPQGLPAPPGANFGLLRPDFTRRQGFGTVLDTVTGLRGGVVGY